MTHYSGMFDESIGVWVRKTKLLSEEKEQYLISLQFGIHKAIAKSRYGSLCIKERYHKCHCNPSPNLQGRFISFDVEILLSDVPTQAVS